ncbi:hypothetical protein CK203_114728 [Vitis vinifera]|uniref:Retrovirus-related Pol polyprotein from transposon RE1 n=1 Tax=Vitis vinifera TaxID=29760 RepID=A0A438FF40_VITVI|nr:hypothetical protein CK203_114728 [Vitis vinifera]
MEETKTMKTPMSSSIKLDKDEKGKCIDSTMYRGMIGSLLYLTASRPDIMYGEDCRLGFQIWVAFSSSHASQLALALISLHFWHTQDESSLSLRHKASAQLSCLNRRHAKRELRFVWTRRAVGLRVYESKIWPTMPRFKLREIHLGYLMMMHLILCCESTNRVLPYGCFLTRVFKDVGGNLSKETNFEVPNTYDTYDDQSMGKMKFEKAWDGSWVKRAERALAQAQGQGQRQAHPGVEDEVEIREMEGGVDPQRPSTQSSFTEPSSRPAFIKPPHTKIPHPQAPLASNHAPWMDLSTQISSLGTCIEELTVVNDTRFYSMEDHMDQYQVGFTSQLEYF